MHPLTAHGPQSQSFHCCPHSPFSNPTPTDNLLPSPRTCIRPCSYGRVLLGHRSIQQELRETSHLPSQPQGPGGRTWWRDPRCSSQTLPHTSKTDRESRTGPANAIHSWPSSSCDHHAHATLKPLPCRSPCLTCHAHATPCPCHRKTVKIPMPLGKNAHRARTTRANAS